MKLEGSSYHARASAWATYSALLAMGYLVDLNYVTLCFRVVATLCLRIYSLQLRQGHRLRELARQDDAAAAAAAAAAAVDDEQPRQWIHLAMAANGVVALIHFLEPGRLPAMLHLFRRDGSLGPPLPRWWTLITLDAVFVLFQWAFLLPLLGQQQ